MFLPEDPLIWTRQQQFMSSTPQSESMTGTPIGPSPDEHIKVLLVDDEAAVLRPLAASLETITDLNLDATVARFDQFDVMLAKQRADMNKIIEENEKQSRRREKEAVKRHQTQLEEISRSVAELKKTFTPGEYDKKFKERANEVSRVYTTISELGKRVDEAFAVNQDTHLTIKALEEARRTDLKRVADIQGEITAVRKRAEEGREKIKVTADGIRNIDTRINELLTSEFERKQAQAAFILLRLADHVSLAVQQHNAFFAAVENLRGFVLIPLHRVQVMRHVH